MKKTVILVLTVLLVLACVLMTGCAKKENNEDIKPDESAEEETNAKKQDWDYIEDKGSMTIGITLFEPMNYEDENGEYTGFETEFAQAVCAELGVEAKFQVISWSTKETELNSKNIDCIWNGMTITEERQSTMDISTPYMSNKQVMVVAEGNEGKYTDAASIAGAKVVAEQESAGADVASSETIFADAEFTPVDSQAKVLLEVLSGTADIGIIDYVMSIGSIGAGTDYESLKVVAGMDFAPEEYGIAFRKDSPKTLEKVNGAIDKLAADGTMASIAEKYNLAELLLVG